MDTVVHIVPSFGCGGLERVIVNLIKNSQHYNFRHVVISLFNELTMKSELPNNVEVVSINKSAGNDLSSHQRIYFLLKKYNPRVVHTYNFGALEYQVMALRAGVPIRIHSDHGFGGDITEGKSVKRRLIRKLLSYIIHHYIVVSDDLKNFIINQVKVNPKKVIVIPNGITINSKQKNLPIKIYTKTTPFSLITIGRLAPVKNQLQLLKAFVEVLKRDPKKQITLTLIGEGKERERLEAFVGTCGYQSKIIFKGLCFDIDPILEQSDGFILSSLYEAMPMTVLEAMAKKVPVIATKVGGVCDFISSKEAILVDKNNTSLLADAIDDLYQRTPEQRQSLALNGFVKVLTHYSVNNMVDTYFSYYK